MDLQKKLFYVDMHVKSISGHVDTDAAVRKAALDQVVKICEREKMLIDNSVAEEIKGIIVPSK